MNSLLLGLVVTAAAAQAPAQPRAAIPAAPGQSQPAVSALETPLQPAAPFRRLFSNPADGTDEARQQERVHAALEQLRVASEQSRPKIVCPMVVLRADPSIDPGMIQRPTDSTTTMHIRKIAPAACAE